MARRLNQLATLLVLVLALSTAVFAQLPSDTNNQPAVTTPAPTPTTISPGTPTTPPPNTPTTTPPGGVPVVTTKKPVVPGSASTGSDSGSSSGGGVPQTTTPAPTKTTKAPVVGAAVPAATAAPAITTTSPEILVDRTVKSEYGTRSPSPSDATVTSTSESEASKMGSWLVPAVIGAVIIAALIIMTFFVRSRRGGNADEDYNTPRRGSDNFVEHPKTTTHHVNVPVLGDPVKDKVAADQSSMKTVAVGGAHHSPRAHRVASSPPLMSELNRPPSPGFGTYKQKPMEGSSVVF